MVGIVVGIALGFEVGSKLGEILIFDDFEVGRIDGKLLLIVVGIDDGDASGHSPQYKGQFEMVPINDVLHLTDGSSFTHSQSFISDPVSKVVEFTRKVFLLFKH